MCRIRRDDFDNKRIHVNPRTFGWTVLRPHGIKALRNSAAAGTVVRQQLRAGTPSGVIAERARAT
jgi:hypothetical protein